MIETLSLRNFKVLREVDVRLRPLTLVVGPNGSGKSSILFALNYSLQRAIDGAQGTVSTVRSGFLDGYVLSSRVSDGPIVIELTGSRLGLRLSLDGPKLQIDRSGAEPPQPSVLDLDLKKLSMPSYLREITGTLASDGAGLSWFLSGLYLEYPDRFTEIVTRLREVVPSVRNVRLKRTPLDSKEIGYELIFDMQAGEGIPAYAVSEGTLLTLALLSVLVGPNSPNLVLIDNLERGLHPKALGDLVDQIRSLQKQNPDLQIVATSHSPYLLDFLEADEILLTSLDEDGYSSVKALSDHPDYDRWKDVMAPGEFWSTVGESWVVQKS